MSEVKEYEVRVYQGESGKRPTVWKVKASTDNDAKQLAFALDGGWGKDKDATDMLAIAETYTVILR